MILSEARYLRKNNKLYPLLLIINFEDNIFFEEVKMRYINKQPP
jgi:hypothetical protein